MKTMPFVTLLFSLIVTAVYAVDLSNVRAYPVPFSPQGKNHVLTISDKDDSSVCPGTDCSVKLEVFDINGDPVVTRNYSSGSPVVWNGRNSRGKYVRPGFYILKLTVTGGPDGDDNGNGVKPADPYATKIIKIVVQ